MLKFIIGTDARARRQELYSELAEAGGAAILIVPEQFSFESERLLQEQPGGDDVEVLSFSRLANNIFREYGGLAGDYVDDTVRLLLMSAALFETADALAFYTRRVHGAPFIQKLVKTSGELQNAGASPFDLEQVAERAPDGVLKEKARDLAKIFSAYQAMLQRGFVDPLEDISRAAQLLCSHNYFAGRPVYIDSFTGFTGSEYKLLEFVLEQAPMLAVSLSTDSLFDLSGGTGLFAKTQRTAARLIKYAKRAGVPVAAPLTPPPSGYYLSPMLKHLEENLLRPRGEAFDGKADGSLMIISASDPYDESRFIAASIRSLAEKGLRWRDIAVIGRDLSAYEHALCSALELEEIPYFMDRREDISSLPLAAYLCSALEACRSNFEPAPLFRMLKTGLSPLSPEEIAELENYSVIWNIRGALWCSPFSGNPSGYGLFDEADSVALAKIELSREKIIAPLSRLREGVSDCNGEQFSRALFTFIEESEAPAALEHLYQKYSADGETRRAEELGALWDFVISVLNRFSETLGRAHFSDARMEQLFELALSSARLGSIPRTLDCIAVGTADRMRPFEPKAVFILGVNEGVFPAPPASGALFNDSERDRMAELGLELADTAGDALLSERLFAYTAAAAPSERLFLSFSRCTVSGAPMNESVLIRQCAALFPSLKITESSSFPPEFFLHNEHTAFEALSECSKPSPVSEALRSYLLAKPDWRGKVLRLESPMRASDFRLNNPEVSNCLFGEKLRLSPSRVETYHNCAFSFFVQSGLRLRERRPAELSPLETGTLIHYALQNIVSRHGGAGLAALSAGEISAEVDAVLKDYLRDVLGAAENKSRRFQYLYSRLAGFLSRLFQRLAAEFSVSAFEPVAFELAVGEGKEVAPLTLKTPSGRTVLIEGYIDRVDVLKKNGRKYVRVVDYKSGGKQFELSDVYYGLNLQMLVYLFSVWEGGRGELADCLPAGVLYMPAKDSVMTGERHATPAQAEDERLKAFKMNGLLLDDEDVLAAMEPGLSGVFIPARMTKSGLDRSSLASLAELGDIKKHVEALLSEMAQELVSGNIGAVPAEKNGEELPCRFCRYRALCRRSPGDPCSKLSPLGRAEFFAAIKGGEGDE